MCIRYDINDEYCKIVICQADDNVDSRYCQTSVTSVSFVRYKRISFEKTHNRNEDPVRVQSYVIGDLRYREAKTVNAFL